MFLVKSSLIVLILAPSILFGMDADFRKIMREHDEAQRKNKADYDVKIQESRAGCKATLDQLQREFEEQRKKNDAEFAQLMQETEIQQKNNRAIQDQAAAITSANVKQYSNDAMALMQRVLAGTATAQEMQAFAQQTAQVRQQNNAAFEQARAAIQKNS